MAKIEVTKTMAREAIKVSTPNEENTGRIEIIVKPHSTNIHLHIDKPFCPCEKEKSRKKKEFKKRERFEGFGRFEFNTKPQAELLCSLL